jgi:L-lactate dehydrogenase (cytochrome)
MGQSQAIWYYMLRNRGFVRGMLDEAAARGVTKLVFTADLPMPGARYRDLRSGLAGAPGLAASCGGWGRL